MVTWPLLSAEGGVEEGTLFLSQRNLKFLMRGFIAPYPGKLASVEEKFPCSLNAQK